MAVLRGPPENAQHFVGRGAKGKEQHRFAKGECEFTSQGAMRKTAGLSHYGGVAQLVRAQDS